MSNPGKILLNDAAEAAVKISRRSLINLRTKQTERLKTCSAQQLMGRNKIASVPTTSYVLRPLSIYHKDDMKRLSSKRVGVIERSNNRRGLIPLQPGSFVRIQSIQDGKREWEIDYSD